MSRRSAGLPASTTAPRGIRALVALLRPWDWIKNTLVLGPLFFSGGLFHAEFTRRALIALGIFCLVSSATYVFNDWCDRAADSRHIKKKLRPLAAGTISGFQAMAMIAGLLVASLILALWLELTASFLYIVLAYIVLTVSYSLGLKHVSVIELFCISGGFVLRFFAGVVVVGVLPSPWIIVATAMGAMLVVAAKRRADLAQGNDPRAMRRSLRGYNIVYLDSLVTSLSGGTLVVYLLFCVSDYAESRYGHGILLTAIPVAVGLLRFQQIVLVEGGGDSPTNIMIKDIVLVATSVVFITMFWVLLYP